MVLKRGCTFDLSYACNVRACKRATILKCVFLKSFRTHMHTHTCTQARKHACTQTCRHVHIFTRTNTPTHKFTYVCTHRPQNTHTRTSKLKLTLSCLQDDGRVALLDYGQVGEGGSLD